MNVYAVVNSFGHYGGDYDEMNCEYSVCLGIFSSFEKAYNCLLQAIGNNNYAIEKKETDPLKHRDGCIYSIESDEFDDDPDWFTYCIYVTTLDKTYTREHPLF